MENQAFRKNIEEEFPLVSIVTACYKSVPYLERIYASIKSQEYENLEWITVDDVSPDNTLEKLAEIKDRNEIKMNILPLSQNTMGFGAIKAGIGIASGKFTIILDHDDELVPGAISRWIKLWNQYATVDEKLYGIWGRCVNEKNEFLGKKYDALPMICSNQYFFHTLKCHAECFLMADTQILRQYYTLKPGETLKTNGSIWNEIGQSYRSIFTNELVRRYYTNIPGSQTSQKKTRTPAAIAKQSVEYLNSNHNVFFKDLFFFSRLMLLYHMYSHYAGVSVTASIKKIKYVYLKIAAIILLPVVPVLLLREKIMNK